MIKVISLSTREREVEFEVKYREYKYLFYNTTLTRWEILDELGISYTSCIRKRISEKWKRDDEVNPISRGMRIKNKSWLE